MRTTDVNRKMAVIRNLDNNVRMNLTNIDLKIPIVGTPQPKQNTVKYYQIGNQQQQV